MKKLVLFIINIVLSGVVIGQQSEAMFTQFYNSPLQINPANTGLFAGRARVIANYKRQWESFGEMYKTIGASADFQLIRELTGADFLGVGIDFIQDVSGISELTNLSGRLNLSYTKAMDSKKSHFVSVGFGGGYLQKSINPSAINWGSQWEDIGFNPTIWTPDQILDESVSLFDISAGVNYFYARPDDAVKFYIGVGGFHLNTPVVSFLSSEDIALLRKFNVSTGLKYRFGPSLVYAIFPTAIYSWQGNTNVLIYGLDFEYRISEGSRLSGNRKYTSFAIGIYHRWAEVMSPMIKLHKAGFTLTFSYDFEVGNITRITNGMNGMEVSLKYRVGYRNGRDSKNVSNAFF